MERGTPGERYLVGGYNWTFAELFGRLERLTKVAGAARSRSRGDAAAAGDARAGGDVPPLGPHASPVEPQSVEMAEYFWYFDSGKAARELGFMPRDATDTLLDTVKYIRERTVSATARSGNEGAR